MSVAEKISITLTPEMNRMIKREVDEGRYGSTSEVIREALRLWQRREEDHKEALAGVRARIQASIDDSRPSLSLADARADFSAHVAAKEIVAS